MKSEDILDRSPEAATRILTLKLLDEAAAAAARLPDEGDVEALHDFRVALRRLRSLLKAYRPLLQESLSKKQRRALRELAQSTGGARDSEVQLAWLAAQTEPVKPQDQDAWSWLTQRLEGRRAAAYLTLRGGLQASFAALEPKMRKGLSRYVAQLSVAGPGRTFAAAAGERVEAAADALRQALEGVKSSADVEGAHAARIDAKRLRYLLEPLRGTALGDEASALVKSMKALQETLGELHDAHVMAAEVASCLVETATARARALHDALYTPGASAAAKGEKDLRAGLLAVDRRVRDRVEGLFKDLAREWISGGLAQLHGQAVAFAGRLAAHATAHLEIERKYLLSALPPIPGEPKILEVTQGWLPGESIRERLRRTDSTDGPRFYRTIKLGTGIARIELEDEVPGEVFEKLWPLTQGHRVHKRRYKVPEGERVWEIDAFADRELFLAEIELATQEEAVELPAWLAPLVVREVTGDPQYVNENLAR